MNKIKITGLVSHGDASQTTIELDKPELANLRYNSRITVAKLKVTRENYALKTFTVKHDFNGESIIIDVLKSCANNIIGINITDILIKYLKLGAFGSIVIDGLDVADVHAVGSAIEIEYIQESEYGENHAIIDRRVGAASVISVDISNGELRHSVDCISAALPGGTVDMSLEFADSTGIEQKIFANDQVVTLPKYNCGTGFKLNLQQYIVKSKTSDSNAKDLFYYIDSTGRTHEFNDKYYYNKPVTAELEKTVKEYISKESIEIALDGQLTYKDVYGDIYDVFLEQVTDGGFKLIDKKAGFKGVELLEQRRDEIAQLEEEINQLNRSLRGNAIAEKELESNIEQIKSAESELRSLFASKALIVENQKTLVFQANQILADLKSQKLAHYTQTQLLELEKVLGDKDSLDLKIKGVVAATNYELNVCRKDIKKDDYASCFYYTEVNGAGSTAKCIHGNNMCGLKINPFLAWGDSINTKTYNYDTAYSCDNTTASGLYDLRTKTLAAQNPMSKKCSYDSHSGYVTELNITIKGSFNDKISSLSSGEYPQSVMKHIYGLSLQYESMDNELCNINRRLEFYMAQGKSPAEAVNDFKEIILKLDVDTIIDDTYYNTVYMQYITAFSNLKQIKSVSAEYSKNLSKTKALLDKYNASDIQIYLLTATRSVMGFATIKDAPNVYILTDIVDPYDNALHLTYERNRLISLSDGEKEYIKLKYNNKNLINEAKSDGGKSVKLKYNGDKLMSLTDLDGVKTEYTYSNNKITAITSDCGAGVKLEYDALGRVLNLTDTNIYNNIDTATAPKDAVLRFDTHLTALAYPSVSESIVKYYSIDGAERVLDGTVSYQFDVYGRTVTSFKGEVNNACDVDTIKALKTFDYNAKAISYSVSPKPYAEALFTAKELLTLSEANPIAKYPITDLTKINTAVSPQRDFMLSAFACADSAYVCRERNTLYAKPCLGESCRHACADGCVSDRRFELKATITYANGNVESQHCSFDWMITTRQFLALPLCIKDSCGAVTAITLTADYSNNTGSCLIDNITVLPAEWEYKEYNGDNQVTFAESSSSDITLKCEYNDDKLPIKTVIDIDGRQYPTDYEYNLQGALLRTIDYNGMCSETVYNDKGSAVKTMTYNITAPASKYISETLLDDSGNTAAQLSELGGYNADEYTYEHGRLIETRDANGHTTALGYDGRGNTVHRSASAGGQVNDITSLYNLGLATTLTHNAINFDYTYDARGGLKALAIAGENYLTRENDLVNRIEKTIFATGEQYITAYDIDGNTTEVNYSKGGVTKEICRNIYNAVTGDLQQTIDKASGELYTVNSTYDDNGRVINTAAATTDAAQWELQQVYDKRGNIASLSVTADGVATDYVYSYDDSPDMRLKSVGVNGKAHSLTHDKLGRVTYVDNAGKYGKAYSYLHNGEHATKLVSKLDYYTRGKLAGHIRYTYDKVGNIERVIDNGGESERYYYDGINRLVREDNKQLDITATYSYDAGGNINQKSIYPYTNIENIDTCTAISVKDYVYSADGNRDRLLSYDREEVQYDSKGNPLIYRNTRLEWGYVGKLLRYGLSAY